MRRAKEVEYWGIGRHRRAAAEKETRIVRHVGTRSVRPHRATTLAQKGGGRDPVGALQREKTS